MISSPATIDINPLINVGVRGMQLLGVRIIIGRKTVAKCQRLR